MADHAIPDGVPSSRFRNAIPNANRYTKHNERTLEELCKSCFEGDLDTVEELLATGDAKTIFNGDVNAHLSGITALHLASQAGEIEIVELLLRAKADPHMKEVMPYGKDPQDGRTALEFAKEWGCEGVVDILEQAEKDCAYGWYVPEGPTNNTKCYGQWEFVAKPPKDWYVKRPGVIERNGLDPVKYGLPALQKKVAAKGRPPSPVPSRAALPESVAPAVQARQPSLPIGLLFPGQGSQYVKMMSSVKDIPAVQEMLTKAAPILGFDVLELCLRGPESQLEETRFCQPAMFIAGLAGVEKLRAERPEAVERCQVVAGLSLGEYTALCIAGVFSFEDGLRLVKLRGEAMQEAAANGKQGMLSVAGLEKTALESLCVSCRNKEGGDAVCQIANELFPKGYSCAGTEKAILQLKVEAEKAGALQAKLIKTSGAFHTSLMAPAKERLGKALDELLPSMSPPRTTVYMNVSAEPMRPGTDPKLIVAALKEQMTSPVLWEPSCRAMIKEGVSEFFEVGPMKQIKAMMKRIDSKVWGSTTNVEV